MTISAISGSTIQAAITTPVPAVSATSSTLGTLAADSLKSQELSALDGTSGASTGVAAALSAAYEKLLGNLSSNQTLGSAQSTAIQSFLDNSIQNLQSQSTATATAANGSIAPGSIVNTVA